MIRRDILDNPLPPSATVDPKELAYYTAMAEEWWKPQGRFASLHRLNPVRLRFICDRVARHFGRNPDKHLPLQGLRVLDIGCGGGLLSEPMTYLGADVTGIDATGKLVQVARVHAVANAVDIDYRHALAEDLLRTNERFDVIVNAEVIEHVADVDQFVESCCQLMKPGAIMIVATLNRTLKSLLFAKIAGEYILRLLPRGTHDWNRFIRPRELETKLIRFGVQTGEVVGVGYNPLLKIFRINDNPAVNYMAVAVKPKVTPLRLVGDDVSEVIPSPGAT